MSEPDNLSPSEKTSIEKDLAPGKDLGEQPLAVLLTQHNLKAHDIVAASTEQLTHKMVSRGAKGRRLSPHVKMKILVAFNKASGEQYSLRDLFNY